MTQPCSHCHNPQLEEDLQPPPLFPQKYWYIAGCVVALAIVGPPFVTQLFDTVPDGLHQWGDAYNVVNPLISAIAFVGFLFALHHQQHELSLQRKEIQASAKAQADMAKSAAQQAEFLMLSARVQALNVKYEYWESKLKRHPASDFRNFQNCAPHEQQEHIKLQEKVDLVFAELQDCLDKLGGLGTIKIDGSADTSSPLPSFLTSTPPK